LVSAGPILPVYIEGNHAGSFYWLARNLDWTQKYHLVLFDHHSDATALFNSDFIRETLNNRNGSKKDNVCFTSWKKEGIIQCFNWIEPLLPHPIHKVTWVPDGRLTSAELIAKKEDVIKNINEHISVAPRSSGDLSNIYTINDFATQKGILNFNDPVIVTIDLDYFVDTPNEEIEPQFADILDYVLHIKQLKAITVSISRPYLKSDEQADLLLSVALKYFSQVINSKIYFEPFISYGPDRSELAKAYYKKHLPVPSYDVRKASSRLISLILQNPSRYVVSDGQKRWKGILDLWLKNYKQPELVLSDKDGIVPIQPCNYFDYRDDFTISVNVPFEHSEDFGITWKAVSFMEKSYNILGKGGFAENAPAFVVFKEISLNGLQNKCTIRSDQLNNLFDDRTGFGTIRLFAEIMRNGTYYRTKMICISKYVNTGYTGKLTEIFNLPYVLGSGFLNVDGLSGADAHYGADCLNFIIYGQRRLGSSIPYLNDNNLRQYLIKVDDVLYFKDGIAYNDRGKVVIDAQSIDDGLLLHFGTHIAALYQDNEPRNILNDDDLVIHQLENKPEIIELKKLKQSKSPFMLMKFR
jgi:hypothetical protein